MTQQIINIPINWDDKRITELIETGVSNEIKNACMKRLGVESRYSNMSWELEEIIKSAVKEILQDNKDYIIEQVINKCYKSMVSTKAYKEAKAKL